MAFGGKVCTDCSAFEGRQLYEATRMYRRKYQPAHTSDYETGLYSALDYMMILGGNFSVREKDCEYIVTVERANGDVLTASADELHDAIKAAFLALTVPATA